MEYPYQTWASKSKSDRAFCWIEQLPPSLEKVRTMTFRYNASFHAGGENLMGVRSHAQALLVALRNNRTGILVIVLPSSLVVCNDVLSLVPTPFCFCVPYFGRISC